MRHKASKGIAQCRFPSAVTTDDCHKFTLLYLQVDVLQSGRISQWVFISDVLQVYDSHNLRRIERMTRPIRTQRSALSRLVSGISYKDVLARVEVNPRASMAMARSSTSTSEPKTRGPMSGKSEPIRLKKLLCVSNPRERCAAMIVCALACICGRICRVDIMTYANCGGRPRRVRSDINSLGWVVNKKRVNEETMTIMRVAFRRANSRLSFVISRNQILKTT